MLYEGLGKMLFIRTCYSEAIEAFTTMRNIAETIADVPAQARAWNELAYVQEWLGDYRASLEHAQKARKIARNADTGDQTELIMALIREGKAFYRLGNTEQALMLLEKTLALSTKLNARHKMAHSLNVLGLVNMMLGCYEQAVSHYEKALAIEREIGNLTRVAIVLNNLAETARMRGDYQAALHNYREALTLVRKTGNRGDEMLYRSNRAGVLVESGEYSAAETELQQVIAMASDTDSDFLAETYSFLAKAHLGQGNVKEALAAAQQAVMLAQEVKNPEFLALAWRVLGQVAVSLSSVRVSEQQYTAIECFAESVRIAKENDMEGYQAHTLKAWAEYELRQGDREKGEVLRQEAWKLFEKLGIEMERMDEKEQESECFFERNR
jgi:tetratricopeptide (TPR) repeat protein